MSKLPMYYGNTTSIMATPNSCSIVFPPACLPPPYMTNCYSNIAPLLTLLISTFVFFRNLEILLFKMVHT